MSFVSRLTTLSYLSKLNSIRNVHYLNNITHRSTSTLLSYNNNTQYKPINDYIKLSYSKKKSKKDIDEDEDIEDTPPATTKKSKKGASKDTSTTNGTTPSKLELTLKEIEQTFGKGTLMKLGSAFVAQPVEVVSTGSLGLDIALGVGGLPKGRIVEIFGPESSGKTTLALHVIAQAQKNGANCTFIDAENALNPSWAQKLGVNLDKLFFSQPSSGDQALEIVDSLLRSKTMQVIVVDSVAALVSKVELDGEMGDAHVGVQARLMSQALRKLSPNLKDSNCVVIFLNQIRMKIGVMFGNPEVTSGGRSLAYYSSIRLDIRKVGAVKKGDEVIASQVKVKVAKNKLAPPYREAIFDIDFNSGINKTGEIIDLAIVEGIMEKGGSWYSYNGQQLAQGREKTKQYLEENPSILNQIETKLRDKLVHVSTATAEEEEQQEFNEEEDLQDEVQVIDTESEKQSN